MQRGTTGPGIGLVLVLVGTALGQIESHIPPKELGPGMVPRACYDPPLYFSREIDVPLAHETAEKPYFDEKDRLVWGDEGDPDATDLNRMCKLPRTVVQLAQTSKWDQAIAAAPEVMKRPKERCLDYTWDYFGNALAWSHVQKMQFQKAADVHAQVAVRIDDPAVSAYHRLCAKLLARPPKEPSDLKDWSTFKEELIKLMKPDLDKFSQRCRIVRTAGMGLRTDARLGHLQFAYNVLRTAWAVDEDLGRSLKTQFRPAADTIGKVAAESLQDIRELTRMLLAVEAKFEKRPFNRNFGPMWNKALHAVWGRVAQTKRLCRIHAHLAKAGLASPGMADSTFRSAHGMLFAPESPGTVYQELGGGVPGAIKDMRCRAPYEQTKIQPM